MRPHQRLVAWQEAIQLVKGIYSLTSNLPKAETYNLTSQLRRAAVSVPTNIAEGAARNTEKEFRQFLFISSGSCSEIDTLLIISKELGILSNDELKEIMRINDRVSALINGLIRSIKLKV